MAAKNIDEQDPRLLKAVDYMQKEYGDGAISEAATALEYARQLNDNDTVDVFSDILSSLTKRAFETNALVGNGSVSAVEAKSIATGTGVSNASVGRKDE